MGSDDALVREKATLSLKKVSDCLTSDQINDNYLQVVDRLREGDQFSMRIASSQLLADIYPKLTSENQHKVLGYFDRLCSDDTPMVRWGAAQAISTLATYVGSVQLCEHILPIMKQLLSDKNDSVKVHAVGSCVSVVKNVKDIAKIQEMILPSLKQAQQTRGSWRIRFAVAESAA